MSDHRPVDPAKLKRLQRLEEELKENLRRRKLQARTRREVPEPSDGLDKRAHTLENPAGEGDSAAGQAPRPVDFDRHEP